MMSYSKHQANDVTTILLRILEFQNLKGQYTLRKLGGATPYDQKGNYFSEYLWSVKYRNENGAIIIRRGTS